MNLVKEILAKVEHLPAIPGVVQQVLAEASSPDFSYQRLMEIIQVDPAITAHVLRICNSPYYGLRQKISSLKQALTLLGINNIVDIVLTSEVVTFFRAPQDGYALNQGDLWRHCLATALLAQSMGEEQRFSEPATLFTAALLHDVGKLILSQYVGDKFEKIQDLVRQKGLSFVEAERRVLGVDHAVLGGYVAKHWNFPDSIVRAIALHHDPNRARSDSELTRLVALANLVVVSVGVGGGADGLAAPVAPGLLEKMGLAGKALDHWVLRVKDVLDQAEDMLSMAN